LYHRYAKDVVSGKVVAGELVIAACRRHLDDLQRGDDFPYCFDDAKANRVIDFIQLLPHVKGKWASKRELLVLQPWQAFIVASIFGWVHKDTGLRRFREVYAEIPRKNGKSVLAAGIGLYMLLADGEYGAEVYSGATTEKQAWEVFRPSKLMAKKTPALMAAYGLEVNASNLLVPSDYSRFEPLIGNPGDGSSPSCALVDEYHEHANSDLYDTMQTGMGAREQPLILVITTAGSNIGGPCYEKRAECKKILKKVFSDERFFGVVYGLDEGDDFKNPAIWAKANPNLGISVSSDYLEAQVASAIRSPVKQNAVLTRHFNQWVGARAAWLNMETWNCAADPDLDIADFADQPCMVGLDLAVRVDIAARISLFWKDIGGVRHYFAFPHFYLPEDSLITAKNAKMYAGWAKSGYIQLMDGGEIGLAEVQADILALPEKQQVNELVYDPWQSSQIAQEVRKEGVEAVEYRNTVANLNPPMRELEGALASNRFHHPGNPVFDWMASNVVAKSDAKNNIFPRKEREESKIDGIIALLFAMGRAMHGDENGDLDDWLSDPLTMNI
jgi:phage terminase large subunit-like protein